MEEKGLLLRIELGGKEKTRGKFKAQINGRQQNLKIPKAGKRSKKSEDRTGAFKGERTIKCTGKGDPVEWNKRRGR